MNEKNRIMNGKNKIIIEILSMNFDSKRISSAIEILDNEIQNLEEKLDNIEKKEQLSSKEQQEQQELLELGQLYDREKELLIMIQEFNNIKKNITKNKTKKFKTKKNGNI